MIILAIDSGIERTGWAIFKINKQNYFLMDFGCIITNKKYNMIERSGQIYIFLGKLFKKYKPVKIIIEKIFFNINKKTIISVAQSQGIIFTLASQKKISVEELTPLQIKQILTGYGRADKKQVKKMVEIELKNKYKFKYDDTIDAIACGLAFYYNSRNLLK